MVGREKFPCYSLVYQHKQETNPDALSHCWDNLSLGCPPWKTLPVRLQPLSFQSLTAKQTSLERKTAWVSLAYFLGHLTIV